MINVPVGAAMLLAGVRFLSPDRDTEHGQRLDLAGVAVLSITMLLIILPLTLSRGAHWPAWTFICLLASLPSPAAFIAIEGTPPPRGAACP